MQEGALIFPSARDRQDRNLDDPVQTSLMFHLVYLMRRYTAGYAGVGRGLYGSDLRMPAEGKPCWPIALAFVDAALSTYTEDARSAERRFTKWLKQHPEVQLGHWPNANLLA